MLELTVPATTANLGPGFDVLGMALAVRNRFRFSESKVWIAQGHPVDPETHLTLATARRAARHFGGTLSPLAVTQREDVPRSRGMGSSATARVAGLEAALHYSGLTVPLEDRLQFLSDQEGHPDNVVPAAVGGLTLCGIVDGALQTLRIDPPELQVALCIPDHEVSTEAARARLPEQVPFADAVYNVSAVAFLLAGLARNDLDAVRLGLRDRLHQPWRAPLIGPVDDAFQAAVGAGALGGFISGSGSTLAALVPPGVDGDAVAEALASPFADRAGTRWQCVAPDREGVRVES